MVLSIVTDERRRNGPKAARPFGVARESPPAALRRLDGAAGPPSAPRLAGGLSRAILAQGVYGYRP